MSKLSEDKRKLSDCIAGFAEEHGAEELAKVLCRTIIAIAYHGGRDAEFTSDAGTVKVTLTPIPDELKS